MAVGGHLTPTNTINDPGRCINHGSCNINLIYVNWEEI